MDATPPRSADAMPQTVRRPRIPKGAMLEVGITHALGSTYRRLPLEDHRIGGLKGGKGMDRISPRYGEFMWAMRHLHAVWFVFWKLPPRQSYDDDIRQ